MAISVFSNSPFQKPLSQFPKESLADDEKVVYGSPKDIYRNIRVIHSLNKAKFPVYLVSSKVNKQEYAMKVFPFKNDNPHTYFKNEARFTCLQHPNVIRFLHVENEKDTSFRGVSTKVSYIMMEYAPCGDFFDFIMNHWCRFDEKLARTYFRQLIDGIEYLHRNGVAHMDLKLENLLLSRDFTLKIIDFDLSYYENDLRVISKGTRFYRAPEVQQGTCENAKAADIYSAGVILFCFITHGILPHSESNLIDGLNFSGLLQRNDPKFWSKHCEIQDENIFSEDFRSLFISMTKYRPQERITIQEIKKSNWYNGPIYNKEELTNKVEKILHT